MAQLCPSCNKFAGLELQDPEVNSVELNDKTISVEVRIVRNSSCCNDEMKEYTFNVDHEIDGDLEAKMDAILKDDPNAEFDVEDNGAEQVEEGGSRYAKSYYGFTMTVPVKHGDDTLGEVTIADKVAASGMDELT
jgi:hypothetical protein